MFESRLNNWIANTAGLEPLKLYGGALLALHSSLFMRPSVDAAQNVSSPMPPKVKVIVSRSAIVELVQSACAQIESVSKPRVSIRIRRGIPHFQVRLKLSSGGRLRDRIQPTATITRGPDPKPGDRKPGKLTSSRPALKLFAFRIQTKTNSASNTPPPFALRWLTSAFYRQFFGMKIII